MRKIVLPQNVRVFKISYGTTLGHTNYMLRAGDEVMIGPVQEVHYDHRTQLAVPFIFDSQQYFILLTESGLNNLIN